MAAKVTNNNNYLLSSNIINVGHVAGYWAQNIRIITHLGFVKNAPITEHRIARDYV